MRKTYEFTFHLASLWYCYHVVEQGYNYGFLFKAVDYKLQSVTYTGCPEKVTPYPTASIYAT